MTPSEIQQIVEGGESETVEFKKTTGQRRRAAETVCGMLNAQGGFVLFGVTPGGEIRGQEVSDDTLQDIIRELGKIEPPILLQPETVPVSETHDLTPLQRELLNVLGNQGPMALSDIIERVDPDVTERTVQRNLKTLRELSMVRLEGHGRGARWMIPEDA